MVPKVFEPLKFYCISTLDFMCIRRLNISMTSSFVKLMKLCTTESWTENKWTINFRISIDKSGEKKSHFIDNVEEEDVTYLFAYKTELFHF